MRLLLILLMGCQGTPRQDLAPEPAQTQLIVLVPEALKGELDPRLNTRAWPAKIIHLIFEGVTSVHYPDMQPRPALAERIEQPNPLTYEITLRSDALFHDGMPVTSEDVAATYESVRAPQLNSPLRSMYMRIAHIEILDNRRLRLILTEPHAPFLSDLSLGVLPARSLSPSGALIGPLIGAGPYQMTQRRGASEVRLSRFEGYWRGAPQIPQILFRVAPDENTRVLALLSGAADLIQNSLSPLMAHAMRDRPGLVEESAPGVAYAYLAFNLQRPPLDQLKVRQALAHALDRDRLITHKFFGRARASTGMLAPDHWAYTGDVPRYPHDPARAEALLDEAGLPRGADGVRLRLTLKTSSDKFRGNLARLMAADFARVGVVTRVAALEKGTLLHDAKRGHFDLYMLEWIDPSEPHFYNWIFHSQSIPTAARPSDGGNRGAYRNAEVDRLIDEGRREVDPRRRAALYAQVQRLVAADLPYLSLWHRHISLLRVEALRGYTPLPDASLFNLWSATLERGG